LGEHRRHIQATERESEKNNEAERARPAANRESPADVPVH